MEQYNITGMSCAACSSRVEKAVSAVEGVSSCSVSLLTNSMGVEGTADPGEIIAAVENAGYAGDWVASDDGILAVAPHWRVMGIIFRTGLPGKLGDAAGKNFDFAHMLLPPSHFIIVFLYLFSRAGIKGTLSHFA